MLGEGSPGQRKKNVFFDEGKTLKNGLRKKEHVQQVHEAENSGQSKDTNPEGLRWGNKTT